MRWLLFILFTAANLPLMAQEIHWQSFSADIFKQAQLEHKPVLLDLGASWCHWCHVMDDSTYNNPQISKYLAENYITVREDQDKRPDLFARYKDYGWPATIIFYEDGREILKNAGYEAPEPFLALLQKAYAAARIMPPAKSGTTSQPYKIKKWSPATATFVRNNFISYLDMKKGGYDMQQRFLEYDGIAYALQQYQTDSLLRRWLRITIPQSYKLNDSVWGGVYQYSTRNGWDYPHFEKILSIQARYIKIYADYYATTKDSSALLQARHILSYLNQFLCSPSGLYYNSQDADLVQGVHAGDYFQLHASERLQQGIPRIDSTCYAKENAQLATALLHLYTAAPNPVYLQKATTILKELEHYYKTPDGGYLHDTAFKTTLTLSDILYTGIAQHSLYKVTANAAALVVSRRCADYILSHFMSSNGGLYSFIPTNKYLPADYSLTENIDACRFFRELAPLAPMYKKAGDEIFGYISSPAVLQNIIAEPGILLAAP
ncbi:DUF255 domain-containing protein [Chitinophaga sp. sic0106]|uniref:DUF255 domain-containing protein n=1 Tax=Chitinophaga sp. sic0106 TaxID=2854785 RepID=UPI001C43DCAA|nr:DUF255 domain-containing protein [Chitinophaga sp. sic0106]MBV7534024.1 DUF255 domain-containing protein [Chitinophaga sp. sic0106]